MSDNLHFLGDRFGSERRQYYHGPWQLLCRDIDPSLLIRRCKDEPWKQWPNPTWWRPFTVRFPDTSIEERIAWLWSESDTPNMPELLEVYSPSTRGQLVLSAFYDWRETADEEAKHIPRRDAWVRIFSILVRQVDLEKLVKFLWAKDLRESTLFDFDRNIGNDVFLGEHPWHPACCSNQQEWRPAGSLPVGTLIPDGRYTCERGGYDYSIDATINLRVPSAWLIREMGLHFGGGRRLCYLDAGGEVVFFDPSVVEDGPAASLVDKDKFQAFLKDRNLAIVWAVAGERGLYGERLPEEFYGRNLLAAVYWWRGSVIEGKQRLWREEPQDNK